MTTGKPTRAWPNCSTNGSGPKQPRLPRSVSYSRKPLTITTKVNKTLSRFVTPSFLRKRPFDNVNVVAEVRLAKCVIHVNAEQPPVDGLIWILEVDLLGFSGRYRRDIEIHALQRIPGHTVPELQFARAGINGANIFHNYRVSVGFERLHTRDGKVGLKQVERLRVHFEGLRVNIQVLRGQHDDLCPLLILALCERSL